jgi:hypothetical protein
LEEKQMERDDVEERIRQALRRFGEAQEAFGRRDFDRSHELLESLVDEEPFFAVAARLDARALQCGGPPDVAEEDAQLALRRAGALLRRAVKVGRDPDAMCDLGHFINAIEDEPARAIEPLLTSATSALDIAGDALDGLISCGEQLGQSRLGTTARDLRTRLRHLEGLLEKLEELPDAP